MLRAGALLLLCICGLSSLVACVATPSHAEPKAEHTRADCSGCHEREYRKAPHHVDAKPTRCATCHSETSWKPTQLTHAWPLTGAHAKADCAGCHKGWTPTYEHTDRTCGSCHRDAFEKASVPGHAQVLLSSNCQDCHNTQTWRPTGTKQLQLSAAISTPVGAPARHTVAGASTGTVASEPGQRAHPGPTQAAPPHAGVAATPAAHGAVPALAAEPAQRAQASSAGTTSPVGSTPVQPGSAAPSEPVAVPGRPLGRGAKSTAGRRARRGESKNRRVLDPTAAAPNAAPGLSEPAGRPTAAASPAARAAATPAKSATLPTLQPTAARASTARSPEPSISAKAPAEPAPRSQPLTAAGKNKPTRPSVPAAQADNPAPQPAEGYKPRAASGSTRAKSPEGATLNDRSK